MENYHILLLILLLLFSGILSGLAAGLLGAGGGTIMVPLTSFVLLFHGVPISVAMHVAVGTSLAIMIISSLSSVYSHSKKKNVQWNFFLKMMPGLIIGAILGATVANYLPGKVLHKVFAIFVLISAIQMSVNLTPALRKPIKNWLLLSGYGVFSGSLSAGLGIGGSIVNVPFFRMNRMEMKWCVATSSASSLPSAIIGTTVFLFAGIHVNGLPPGSVGFINIPILILISLSSIFSARIGARWADWMKDHILRWCFAIFLAIVGVIMLLS